MRDIRGLGIVVDLKEEAMKWSGTAIPMVLKGRWTQKNIENHWRNYHKRYKNLADEPDLEVAPDSMEKELSASV